MPATSPLEAVRLLDDAFCRGDVDAILDFYEDGATLVVQPGMLATGRAELRRAFEAILSLFAAPPVVKLIKTDVIEAGNIALFTAKWSLSGTAKNGEEITREDIASVVLRRQADGTWKLVVDNSYGPAVLE